MEGSTSERVMALRARIHNGLEPQDQILEDIELFATKVAPEVA